MLTAQFDTNAIEHFGTTILDQLQQLPVEALAPRRECIEGLLRTFLMNHMENHRGLERRRAEQARTRLNQFRLVIGNHLDRLGPAAREAFVALEESLFHL